METKICSKCKEEKSVAEFHKRLNRKCGYKSQCKSCIKLAPKKVYPIQRKNYELNKSYGINLDDYNTLFSNQNGKCKICDRHLDEVNGGKKKYLCVDHCHASGKIRGLLCDKCNRGIGLFNDDKTLLLKAVQYLKS